jgi:tetratricopeptide (TPR) repeat protein
MLNPWIPILQGLPLSRTEREVVRRFEQDPEGRSFLPVADILRSHRLHDEALELLTQGVERHPGFTVARVCLARDLLQKGLVEAAWRALEESPVPLKENLLAQKLRFRLALLLGREDMGRQTLFLLKSSQTLDAETKRIGDAIELAGFASARDKLIADMKERGTELTLPEAPPVAPAARAAPARARSEDPGRLAELEAQGFALEGGDAYDGAELAAAMPGSVDAGPSFLDDRTLADEELLSGYHVVPLDEIFRPDTTSAPLSAAGGTSGGVELDSTTLADIYERQGHYAKALAVYRRLLRLTPHSDLLRRKVADLTRLDKEQRDVELTVDPALVDKLETVEIIDCQIRFYNDLLSRLS